MNCWGPRFVLHNSNIGSVACLELTSESILQIEDLTCGSSVVVVLQRDNAASCCQDIFRRCVCILVFVCLQCLNCLYIKYWYSCASMCIIVYFL